MNLFSVRSAVNLVILLMVSACATPTSPTGGPPDQEGPHIIQMEPQTGTTNFGGTEIKLSFSEFVNRGSLRQAISIEPDIGIDYSLDWGRRSVAIEFERELPDLTTVIIRVGTDLTDMRGNKMTEPVRIAVSTGPEIDEGEIFGRVIDARTGEGDSGDRVFLYRHPVDLEQRADYAAETDTSGRFHFAYLRQGEYKAFWVNDQNRSKIWEPERERAQPFERESVILEKAGADTLHTLYKAQSDTTTPVLQGVGLFSTQRLRLRFSENIELTDSSRFIVSDTLGNEYTPAVPLYISPQEQYILFMHAEKELEDERRYRLSAYNVEDQAGNLMPLMSLDFDGSAQPDTTLQRIIRQENNAGIYPDEPLEVIYADIITEEEILDSVDVTAGSELTEEWKNVVAERNHLKVLPQERWEQAIDYQVRVWNPLTGNRKPYQLNVWHPVDFGNIYFSVEDTSDHREYQLRVISDERGTMVDTTFTGSVETPQLPPLHYQGIVYGDLNGNGRWDPGQVEPYIAPEPYYIQNRIPVRKGFTSEVTIPFE